MTRNIDFISLGLQLQLGFTVTIRSILGGGNKSFWRRKLQNLPHDTLCLSFSCNLITYFKQALKSDRLGKRCDLKQKMVRFVK